MGYELGSRPDWLMIPLVDELVAAGITLEPGQCYTYRVLPIVDGDYSVENTTVVEIDRHLTEIGSIQATVRDLPNGSLVDVDWNP